MALGRKRRLGAALVDVVFRLKMTWWPMAIAFAVLKPMKKLGENRVGEMRAYVNSNGNLNWHEKST
jgi:hypothetical protein